MNPNKLISAGLGLAALGLLIVAIAFFLTLAGTSGLLPVGLAVTALGASIATFGAAIRYA